MSLRIERTKRLASLPPYLFAELERRKKEMRASGQDLIDLGVGDPDLPTPQPIIEKLCQAAEKPQNHRYPSYQGLLSFRQAIANWYLRKFGVELDPEAEILTLIGSKEGLAHLPLALINPGEIALVPDPAYPVYKAGVIFAGGRVVSLPLLEENHFLPRLEEIEKKTAQEAKLLFLNYPNNPTGAVASESFLSEIVEFAQEHNVAVCHDFAYSQIAYDGYQAPSLLQIKEAKEVGVEFHSLSKTFNMTGWRIGFVVGNRKIIQNLRELKTNVDSGVFQAIQEAGIEALRMEEELTTSIKEIYQTRRDCLIRGLKELGWRVDAPKASFYLWLRVPIPCSSLDFAQKLMRDCGVVVTPGVGFGRCGEGYIRMSLTVEDKRMKEAIERIKAASFL